MVVENTVHRHAMVAADKSRTTGMIDITTRVPRCCTRRGIGHVVVENTVHRHTMVAADKRRTTSMIDNSSRPPTNSVKIRTLDMTML